MARDNPTAGRRGDSGPPSCGEAGRAVACARPSVQLRRCSGPFAKAERNGTDTPPGRARSLRFGSGSGSGSGSGGGGGQGCGQGCAEEWVRARELGARANDEQHDHRRQVDHEKHQGTDDAEQGHPRPGRQHDDKQGDQRGGGRLPRPAADRTGIGDPEQENDDGDRPGRIRTSSTPGACGRVSAPTCLPAAGGPSPRGCRRDQHGPPQRTQTCGSPATPRRCRAHTCASRSR